MKIVCLVLALLTAADAFTQQGFCSGSDLGTEKREETWTCNRDGTADCGLTETTCSCDGELRETGGRGTWNKASNWQIVAHL